MQEVEDSEEFYQEMEEEELATLRKHIRSRKGHRSTRNNSETEELYKKALMDSIFGRFQEASKKLKKMITITPDSPEPYHLLGTMHEQNGELDKAAEYLFMSTYLSSPNLEKWLKVGDLSFERKMFNQAAYCFGRALKLAPCDPKIMVRRAQAFELAGQSKKAIITYKRLQKISQAPEYIKKYAKARYRRAEYGMCREILKSIDNFIADSQLIFMICETYLQEKNYEETVKIMQQHLEYRSQSLQMQEALPAEFIVILLICSVALKRECYGFQSEALLEEVKQCYHSDYSQLYNEAVNHISKFNQGYTFSLVSELIKHKEHQSLSNYIIVTDYLCKKKDNKCVQILEQALKKHSTSPQILAQRDYIYKCFGLSTRFAEPEAIFYSDDDEPLPLLYPVTQKKGMTQSPDNQVMEKLVRNVDESLSLIIDQIGKGHNPGSKQLETVLDGIQFFISLKPSGKQEEAEEKEGLYIKRGGRRRMAEGEKNSIIAENLELVMKYFENLVNFMQHLLSHHQWKRSIQIGQKVSKVHVFKNYSKVTDFLNLKVKIYQMCVLSCLAVHKYNTALFFLRYLVVKHPEDSLYALSLHLLMRVCPRKTFVSSALSKRLNHPGGEHLARLLSVQYMETGCFQLALKSMLRSSQAQEGLGSTSQLCLSACLIQIASSRNTFNKLQYTNRSALCFASYEGVAKCQWQALFNKGRWFAQVKLNHKAIECWQQLLAGDADVRIKQRAAYCLICLYRQCDDPESADALSRRYFSLEQMIDEQ